MYIQKIRTCLRESVVLNQNKNQSELQSRKQIRIRSPGKVLGFKIELGIEMSFFLDFSLGVKRRVVVLITFLQLSGEK
jgi:hypothetical protein